MAETKELGWRCLNCGKILDAAASISGAHIPRPGDVSICFYCGNLAMFTDSGIRPPTVKEKHMIEANPMIQRAVKAVKDAQH